VGPPDEALGFHGGEGSQVVPDPVGPPGHVEKVGQAALAGGRNAVVQIRQLQVDVSAIAAPVYVVGTK